MNEMVAAIDQARRRMGFLSVDATLALAQRGNLVLDPYSTLIAASAAVGSGNVFYPGVTLAAAQGAVLTIGDENVFHAGTFIEAATGSILIEDGNQFGEGGFTAKANRAGAAVTIGSRGRYLKGATLFGVCAFGDGAQVLGPITVDSCVLESGGDHSEPDPDLRGGLLKGAGVAKGLRVGRGEVIAGEGAFRQEDILRQTRFHPKG